MLEKARKSQYKKQSGNKKSANIEIALFNSVSKKELWQFINKLSIFVNSGIDIK
jgi:type II secretory pathway component PulF